MLTGGELDRVPHDQAGTALLRLVAVMDRLRAECPWDARQTHESLAPYLLEETYETIDALDRGDLAGLQDELGDVLLQVLFHSRIASERTDETGFTIDDVANGIADKLIRRHPHVFADVTVGDADEVRKNWDQIKAAERAAAGRPAGSVLDSVPMSQPALSLAAQLQHRAARAGAPPEASQLPGGSASEPDHDTVSEVGAELWDLVARARAAGLDPELELRRAARVYRDRVRAWEAARPGGVPT